MTTDPLAQLCAGLAAVGCDVTRRGNWADVKAGGRWAVVEYRPGSGFGVSDGNAQAGYGEGPDRVVSDRLAAFVAVLRLLGKERSPGNGITCGVCGLDTHAPNCPVLGR